MSVHIYTYIHNMYVCLHVRVRECVMHTHTQRQREREREREREIDCVSARACACAQWREMPPEPNVMMWDACNGIVSVHHVSISSCIPYDDQPDLCHSLRWLV
jgi:hypothetical protein